MGNRSTKPEEIEVTNLVELTEYVVKYKCSIEGEGLHTVGLNKLNMIGKKMLLMSPMAQNSCK